jgi:transglutaminase-like putative cysteine protease
VAGGLAARSDHSFTGPSPGPPPAWAVVPVVGDGRWIEIVPPQEPSGYYDRRPFELAVGIEMLGRGAAADLQATTPVPTPHPEQPIQNLRIETEGCQAHVQAVGEGAAQLIVAAGRIAPGQVIRATARYRLTVAKQCFGHDRDRFLRRQPPPAADIRERYLGNSPGIETRSAQVGRLLDTIRGPGSEHPWDLARRCWTWVREHIRPRIGPYTSVVKAIENAVGDCEEMAGVFVALCRRAEIPARLVWVPNHNWAEFHLVDEEGRGHWIPAHTACYPWFGWTGVHELVIQKGDRVTPAHARSPQRLLEDWGRAAGPRPTFRWTAELAPLAEQDGADPGPGGRQKQASGEWTLRGHRLDGLLRRQ